MSGVLASTRLAVSGVVLALLLLGTGVPGALADDTLVTPTSLGALSAYGGWLAWSEQGADTRWHLVGWHAGQEVAFPVPSRSVPFDVDVGPDAQGRPVLLYSRCARDPQAGSLSFDGVAQWSGAAGCRLHQLDPATGTDTALAVPGEFTGSDSTPSRWFGSIAFARRPSSSRIARVMLWRVGSRAVRRLRAGDVPRRCVSHNGCRGAIHQGAVDQLDLGAAYLAFLWHVKAPSVIGTGTGWGLFAERRTDLRRTLLAGGYVSGTCGGTHPLSPNVAGHDVWFAQMSWGGDCSSVPSAVLVRATPARRRVRGARLPALAWSMARDATGFYTVTGPPPGETSNDRACSGTAAPCALNRLQGIPPLGPVRLMGAPFL